MSLGHCSLLFHHPVDDFAEGVGIGGLTVDYGAEVVIINLYRIDVEVETVLVDELADFLSSVLGVTAV